MNVLDEPFNVLSLFSGVGGLELGLERAGMTVVGQVEIDPYCQRVLAKHWPEVPRHDDVRTCVDWWRGEPRPTVDLVCGGFPCQPFSQAGLREGVADERWLWPPMLDVVRALRPTYILVENVAALLDDADAFGTVLADLSQLGFDADWSVISACAVGAPHVRRRLFLVAYSHRSNGSAGLGPQSYRPAPHECDDHCASAWSNPIDGLMEAADRRDRMVDGIPVGLDRAGIRALGNAVVPQVAEHVGRLILAADREAAA